MPSKREWPEAKNKILSVAARIFAEKSFEGSRIDEIAREAGVPKSLIYYHFKGKDELLEVLFQKFLDDVQVVIKASEASASASGGVAASVAQEMRKNPEAYLSFMMKNYDLMRIIFIDSLKKKRGNSVIFRYAEMVIDAEGKAIRAGGTERWDRDERLVGEFFTHIMPLFSFFCFYGSWIRYFKMEEKAFGDQFRRILEETHGAFHKNRGINPQTQGGTP